ncbi:MAG: NADH ubiquinone oxidoreductase subunit NDUFA12, partial [Ilumatobacteraceae bacterium]
MIVLFAVHALVGAALFVAGGRLRERSFLVAAVAPAATLVWLLATLGGVLDGTVPTEHVSWVPQLGLDIDLRLDGFAALMVLLIAGLGVAVCVYAA